MSVSKMPSSPTSLTNHCMPHYVGLYLQHNTPFLLTVCSLLSTGEIRTIPTHAGVLGATFSISHMTVTSPNPPSIGKVYGRIELLDPSVDGAASLGKVWECRIPVSSWLSPVILCSIAPLCVHCMCLSSQSRNTSSYLPDPVPPSPLFPTPCYWEQLQPAGLEDYCEILFSYFIPLLRRR